MSNEIEGYIPQIDLTDAYSTHTQPSHDYPTIGKMFARRMILCSAHRTGWRRELAIKAEGAANTLRILSMDIREATPASALLLHPSLPSHLDLNSIAGDEYEPHEDVVVSYLAEKKRFPSLLVCYKPYEHNAIRTRHCKWKQDESHDGKMPEGRSRHWSSRSELASWVDVVSHNTCHAVPEINACKTY
nr:hypothetical protein CFP56_13082 [Quercus suber]